MRESIGVFGCSILAILAVIALAVILSVGGWGARVFFADEIGRGNAEIQIQNADSRISNYNYFFNQCASIQTLEQQIDAETNRLENTTDVDTQRVIETNISGLQGQRARAANNYNARASADYTSGQFQDSSLPYQISPSYEAGGTHTQCAR